MERGPLALFGAIIAVGLGPALWVGVQLGGPQQQSPVRPPVVNEQGAQNAGQDLPGGSGAGAEADDTKVIDADPRGHVLPLTPSASAEPSPSASTSSEPPPPSSSSSSPAAEPTSDDPTTPPAESTTAPADDPTDSTEPPIDDETDDPTLSPAPPADDEPAEAHGGSAGDYAGS